eukprot:1428724-Rhodomonas_salina.1
MQEREQGMDAGGEQVGGGRGGKKDLPNFDGAVSGGRDDDLITREEGYAWRQQNRCHRQGSRIESFARSACAMKVAHISQRMRRERATRDAVFVPAEGLEALVGLLELPQLNAQIRGA